MIAQWRRMIAWVGVAVLTLMLATAVAPAAPAHATPASTTARSHAATGGSLALSITNGTIFKLASATGPHFNLDIVLSAPYTGANIQRKATITLATGQTMSVYFSLDLGSTTTVTYYVSDAAFPFTVGNQSAYATFADPTNGDQLLTSKTVTFTTTPIIANLYCGGGVAPLVYTNLTWTPGQSIPLSIQSQYIGTGYPIDWPKGTATITLKGPTTVTYSNLTLNSKGGVTVKAPTTVGYYTMDCKVSGVPDYSFPDTGFSLTKFLVSELQPLGGIKLYTNPRTIVTGTPIQMYIVFEAGPGLPTPTGYYTITIGSGIQKNYTQPLKIAPDGTASITLSPISNLFNAQSVTIYYEGNPYYKVQDAFFPMTNPAIPGSGGGTTPSKPTATPKPHATATVSATATVDAGSGATSGPPAQAPTPSATPSVLGAFGPFSGGGLIALLVIVALLALGGGVGTFALLSRRGSAPVSPDYPVQGPARSPLDVDTASNLDATLPQAPPWWRKDDGPYDGQQ